ncbi:MAG: permease prefix domain 1-containing protein [Verrucomicrobiales bacterium]|nr:permease prefix domain 1-containing protein [Verrucomicrobiales bacterium]
MSKLREWIVRFGGLFKKQRKDREIDDEVESHLQLHIEDNLRLGMTPRQARREAMIKLGGIDSTKEPAQPAILETFWQDIPSGRGCCAKSLVSAP